MRKRWQSTIVLVGVALAVVAGCATGGGTGPAPPSATALSEVQILALGKEVAQCVRNNGLPGFPDPYFDNGQLKLPPVDANVEQQGQAALDGPCREKWQQLEAALPQKQARPSQEPRGPMSAEDLEKLKQFTDCMRQHAFPNWPDPDPTGEYHLASTGLPEGLGKGQRPEDATFRNGLQTCEPFSVPGMGFAN
jgi:hypothetical protein